MKNKWIYIIVGALTGLTLVVLCHFLITKGYYEPEENLELFERYKDRDDLEVSFLKDFMINDTLAVDVTLITAKDSASWMSLVNEMNIKMPPDFNQTRDDHLKHITSSRYCKKMHPEQRSRVDEDAFDLMYWSFYYYSMAIFHVNDMSEVRIIDKHELHSLKNDSTDSTYFNIIKKHSI